MRIERRDDMDTWAEEHPEERDEQLRELVDGLPLRERHLVSRVFFGGAPLAHAAEEIDVPTPIARELLTNALERLGRALQKED